MLFELHIVKLEWWANSVCRCVIVKRRESSQFSTYGLIAHPDLRRSHQEDEDSYVQ